MKNFRASFRVGLLAVTLTGVAMLEGCASTGGSGGGDGGPPPWTPGEYDLRTTVSYRMDTENTTRTERRQYTGELTVKDDGSLLFISSSGLCRDPTPAELAADRGRGGRTFSCQEVRYFLQPSAGTVRGGASVTVEEGFRTRGACMRYQTTAGGDRVCVEYSWTVERRITTKTAALTVIRRR